jgi:hypothetical protein
MPQPLRFRSHDSDLPQGVAEITAKLRGMKLELRMLKRLMTELSPEQFKLAKPLLEPYLIEVSSLLRVLELVLLPMKEASDKSGS